jgi:hypothetical protein
MNERIMLFLLGAIYVLFVGCFIFKKEPSLNELF